MKQQTKEWKQFMTYELKTQDYLLEKNKISYPQTYMV